MKSDKQTSLLIQLIESWKCVEGNVTSNKEILKWIEEKNENIKVNIEKIPISQMNDWRYEKKDGGVVNKSRTFFQIKGIQKIEEKRILIEQPIWE